MFEQNFLLKIKLFFFLFGGVSVKKMMLPYTLIYLIPLNALLNK